jgi:hypothetical protein
LVNGIIGPSCCVRQRLGALRTSALATRLFRRVAVGCGLFNLLTAVNCGRTATYISASGEVDRNNHDGEIVAPWVCADVHMVLGLTDSYFLSKINPFANATLRRGAWPDEAGFSCAMGDERGLVQYHHAQRRSAANAPTVAVTRRAPVCVRPAAHTAGSFPPGPGSWVTPSPRARHERWVVSPAAFSTAPLRQAR